MMSLIFTFQYEKIIKLQPCTLLGNGNKCSEFENVYKARGRDSFTANKTGIKKNKR